MNYVEDKKLLSARNNLNQIYWRIKANNAILEEPDKGQHSWIKKAFYEKSIKKVIGKAVGDCVTGQNEFSDKGDGGVITFKVSPINQKYSRANWNAVVLYNLVEYVKRSVRYKSCKQNNTMYAIPNGFEKYENVTFKQIEADLIDFYTKLYRGHGFDNKISELEDNIKLAINDITSYDNALQLSSTLTKIMDTAYQYNYLDTRLWRIKTLRDLSKRVQAWLDYGEKIISTAEEHVRKIQEFATATLGKIKELDAKEDMQWQNGQWQLMIDHCNEYSSGLKNLRRRYVQENQQQLNELIEEQALKQKDEDLYNKNLISDEMVTDMANQLSNVIINLKDRYKEYVFSAINEDYQKMQRWFESETYVEFTLELLNLESIPHPDNRTAQSLMQARTLHLAPELEEIKDGYGKYGSYLSFTQKIKSPFSAKSDYVQESKLMFCINDTDNLLQLDKIKTTIPVKLIGKKGNAEKLFEYDMDNMDGRPKYGILDTKIKNEFTYCARGIYQAIKFKAEDPILGNIVAMTEDLISELPWKEWARERKAGIKTQDLDKN